MDKTPTRITLRLPADVYTDLLDLAKRDDRSLNGEIVHLLRKAVRQEKPHQKPPN